jgi:hypothetical protein
MLGFSFVTQRARPAWVFLAALLTSGVVGLSSSPAALGACSTGSATFSDTGSEQCYIVPAGIGELQIVAIGAQGGAGELGEAGGIGAQVTSDVGVTAGETLYVEVGVGGGAGGVNGAGAGGGASAVQTCSSATTGCTPTGLPGDPRLVVAGGGGGGGAAGARGGAAGALSGVTCEAGSSGQNGTSGETTNWGFGGGGGTCGAGGAGGAAGTDGGTAGTAGSAGSGGTNSGGNFGGGGGGGGYYGGGGGGASGNEASGGSGGGGSSFGPAVSVLQAAGTGTPSVAITPLAPKVSLGASGSLTFPGTQPQQTVSAPQTLTISNTGNAPLSISSLTFGGSDPGDFFVGSNGCLGEIAASTSCSLTIEFAPQETGARSATLEIASNDPASPASVTLSGLGGQLPQGPPGTNGTNGTNGTDGANGAQGPPGPAGMVELVTCKTVTKKVKGKRRSERVCTTKLVSGTVKFTTAAVERASVSRAAAVYATGTAVLTGSGRLRLLLSRLRRMPAGGYTLTLKSRRGRQTITRRVQITIAR